MEIIGFIQATTEEGFEHEEEISIYLEQIDGEPVSNQDKYLVIRDGLQAGVLSTYASWLLTLSNDKGVVAYFESDGTVEFPH